MKNITNHLLQTINDRGYPLHSIAWSGLPIVDACTVYAVYGNLLVLTSDGTLHGLNSDTGVSQALCLAELPGITSANENSHFGVSCLRLHASSDGRYAGIVVDKGQQGIVLEVQSGTVTMRLHGGDYYEETVPFSMCFLCHKGRNVLIHRTEWNRLDAADPATGESLTNRFIAPYEEGQDRPAHYLDYFHGELRPSPDCSRLLDDGWVWHPISIPRVWSVSDWLRSNVWESEDGASVVDLTMRDDWNTPACWIDKQHIALWGLADWDEEEFAESGQGPGVRIFDSSEGKRSAGRPLPMEAITGRVSNLFSDGTRIYAADETGTTAWDIPSGAPVARLDGFAARLHDSKRSSLIAIAPHSIVELQLHDLPA